MDPSSVRIWYLIGTLSIGGAERTLVDLANQLDQNRFDVTIWTIKKPGPLAKDVAEHVTVRSLGAVYKSDLRVPIRFVRALRTESPDILQSFLFWDNTLGAFAGLASRETTVITGVRSVPNEPSRIRSLVRYGTVKLADHIISNSEAGAEFIVNHGADSDHVSVVHNGRDLGAYRTGTATPELRNELEIPPAVPVVGTVGRLLARKGHYDLLEAWPIVQEDHPDAHLLIVGDGPERDGLEARTQELGIWESVHLPGTRNDVPALLDLMDVFVFPSHYEGLPGALLEAMAAGLPIVATPVDGNCELLDHEESGLFIPVQNSEKLGSTICRLLSQQSLASSMGDKAADVATTNFSIDRMVEEFTEVYQSFLRY